MKRVRQLASDVFLMVVFSLWILVLIVPWLEVFHASFQPISSAVYYWPFLVLFSASLLTKYALEKPSLTIRYGVTIGFLLLHLLLIILLKLPIILYGITLLLLFWPTVRSANYGSSLEFVGDFGLSFVFMLASLGLKSVAGLSLGYGHVVVFFFTGISLTMWFNARKMEMLGFPSLNRGFAKLSLGFSGGLIILALIGRLLFGSSFFAAALTLLSFVYNRLVDLLLLLLYPVLWLLKPIFDWAENYEGKWQMPRQEESNGLEELPQPEMFDSGHTVDLANSLWWVPWLLLCLTLAILLYFAVKRISASEPQADGYKEERGSVFSLAALREDVSSVLPRLPAWLRRNAPNWNDSSGRIRYIYYLLLRKYHQLVPFPQNGTPRSYQEPLQDALEVEAGLLESLTELYNEARYGEKVSPDQAKEAEAIWNRIKKAKRKP